jgi:hypothetical protein
MAGADASIYGQIRPPQPLEGPLDSYGKVLNLKALMSHGHLQDLQTQQLEQNMSEEQGVRDVFKNAAPGSNLESLVPDVLRASPKAGVEFQGKMLAQKKTQAELGKLEIERRSANAKEARDALANVGDQQGYTNFLELAKQRGWQLASNAPPQFDQKWKQDHLVTGDLFIQNMEHEKNRAIQREGHAITLRGQNMTDDRQRELNGIMEGQNIEASPSLIKSIAAGDIQLNPPPTNARNPIMLQRYGQMLEKVKAENPNWSAEMYPTIKRTVGDFAAGKAGQTLKALNTSIDHLDTWQELAEAMKNGNVKVLNDIFNKIGAATGETAPTNFEAARQILGNEIVKGITGAAGGVEDRTKSQEIMGSKAPAQMIGVANTMKKLLGGQVKGMKQQYEAGTYGRKDFAEKYLTPASRKAFEMSTGSKQEAIPASNPELEALLKQYGG